MKEVSSTKKKAKDWRSLLHRTKYKKTSEINKDTQ